MPEQELHGTQVPRLLVDLRRFRPPHRVRAVCGTIEFGTLDPGMDDPQVLSRRERCGCA
jgi:hypothetical protein